MMYLVGWASKGIGAVEAVGYVVMHPMDTVRRIRGVGQETLAAQLVVALTQETGAAFGTTALTRLPTPEEIAGIALQLQAQVVAGISDVRAITVDGWVVNSVWLGGQYYHTQADRVALADALATSLHDFCVTTIARGRTVYDVQGNKVEQPEVLFLLRARLTDIRTRLTGGVLRSLGPKGAEILTGKDRKLRNRINTLAVGPALKGQDCGNSPVQGVWQAPVTVEGIDYYVNSLLINGKIYHMRTDQDALTAVLAKLPPHATIEIKSFRVQNTVYDAYVGQEVDEAEDVAVQGFRVVLDTIQEALVDAMRTTHLGLTQVALFERAYSAYEMSINGHRYNTQSDAMALNLVLSVLPSNAPIEIHTILDGDKILDACSGAPVGVVLPAARPPRIRVPGYYDPIDRKSRISVMSHVVVFNTPNTAKTSFDRVIARPLSSAVYSMFARLQGPTAPLRGDGVFRPEEDITLYDIANALVGKVKRGVTNLRQETVDRGGDRYAINTVIINGFEYHTLANADLLNARLSALTADDEIHVISVINERGEIWHKLDNQSVQPRRDVLWQESDTFWLGELFANAFFPLAPSNVAAVGSSTPTASPSYSEESFEAVSPSIHTVDTESGDRSPSYSSSFDEETPSPSQPAYRTASSPHIQAPSSSPVSLSVPPARSIGSSTGATTATVVSPRSSVVPVMPPVSSTGSSSPKSLPVVASSMPIAKPTPIRAPSPLIESTPLVRPPSFTLRPRGLLQIPQPHGPSPKSLPVVASSVLIAKPTPIRAPSPLIGSTPLVRPPSFTLRPRGLLQIPQPHGPSPLFAGGAKRYVSDLPLSVIPETDETVSTETPPSTGSTPVTPPSAAPLLASTPVVTIPSPVLTTNQSLVSPPTVTRPSVVISPPAVVRPPAILANRTVVHHQMPTTIGNSTFDAILEWLNFQKGDSTLVTLVKVLAWFVTGCSFGATLFFVACVTYPYDALRARNIVAIK